MRDSLFLMPGSGWSRGSRMPASTLFFMNFRWCILKNLSYNLLWPQLRNPNGMVWEIDGIVDTSAVEFGVLRALKLQCRSLPTDCVSSEKIKKSMPRRSSMSWTLSTFPLFPLQFPSYAILFCYIFPLFHHFEGH